jgi:hypothetical protein
MAQQYMASLTFSTPFFLNSVFRADFLHIRTRSVPHPCDFFLAQEWESTNLNRPVDDERQTVVSAIAAFLS